MINTNGLGQSNQNATSQIINTARAYRRHRGSLDCQHPCDLSLRTDF